MPALRHIPALAAAALALLAAGCGNSDKGLLRQADADALIQEIDEAQRALDNGGCQTVERRAQEGLDAASKLNGVDSALQNNIVDGFERLAQVGVQECEAAEDPEKTSTPTPEPTEEPTEVPTEVPTEEPTAVPTPEPTEEPTEAPTIEIPTPEPTEDTGGVVAPDIENQDGR